MLAPWVEKTHLKSPMFKNTSSKVKQDGLIDPSLDEFLSDENRYRQQFPSASGIILAAGMCLLFFVFLLWLLVAD